MCAGRMGSAVPLDRMGGLEGGLGRRQARGTAGTAVFTACWPSPRPGSKGVGAASFRHRLMMLDRPPASPLTTEASVALPSESRCTEHPDAQRELCASPSTQEPCTLWRGGGHLL